MNEHVMEMRHKRDRSFHAVDEIEVGDIIRLGKHDRKVREIVRDPEDRVWWATFAILQTSWTNRPHTCFYRSELKRLYQGIVKPRTALCSDDPLECRVQQQIEYDGGRVRRDWDAHKRYITPGEMTRRVL